ncbi:MAG: hypothetical protein HC881_11015 [Leptolyngbyaceae cyanobacterium SL_7_1]|nr:hypothetical protein [Leptolyngbyaceae cyanobacterium SL_7_1]
MSHELRTPLNAILGFTQLMVTDPSTSAHQQDHLQIINDSGEHLLKLINNVLDLSKIEAGKTTLVEERFDLYNLLDTLEQLFQLQAQAKQISLEIERQPQVPQHIKTDEGKLRQVLLNLLGNAIKFTQIGGVLLQVSVAEAELVFEVKDTGDGIAPEELPTLFEPFVQTETGRQSQQGTGLGLPISHTFVQLMGGTLTVQSQRGVGTCFRCTIPLKAEWAIAHSHTPLPPTAQPQTHRVLVVDDDLKATVNGWWNCSNPWAARFKKPPGAQAL